MINQTPAAHWREKGELDPHGSYYDIERAQLALGDLTDDELANAVFMHGDGKPSIAEITAGTAKMPIVYLTAAKERIRWLSRKVEGLKRIEQSMAEVLRDARKYITALGKPECEISKVQMVVAQIDAIIAGQVQAQHPDDVAVDNFAKAMKEKLAKARAKGRSGWDDPAACSVEHLADLLLDHIGKGNPGTFEDIANFAMMLHQRGADPALLVGKLPASAVTVTETIRTAPERIWLQVGDQSHYHNEPFPSDTSEVSWCADSVAACEVPYVRDDLTGWQYSAAKQGVGLWVMVPVTPTEEMLGAAEVAISATGGLPEIWEAMLEAASQPNRGVS